MGSLGDKYGRRPALQIGFLVFGVGSAISAIVGSPGHLIASRAVMGVGAALIMPATLSIITNVFPADERPKAIAIWTATAVELLQLIDNGVHRSVDGCRFGQVRRLVRWR